MKLGDGHPKPVGTIDFYGQCSPLGLDSKHSWRYETFSVGFFQWVIGKKRPTKKGPIVARMRFKTGDPSWRAHCLAKVTELIEIRDQYEISQRAVKR